MAYHPARYVDYKNITKVIKPGRIIYVDDGVLAFDVLEIVNGKTIKVRARNNGFISSRKGVNLPNTDVDLPALSEKDKADLRFGVKNNVDMVFACMCYCVLSYDFRVRSLAGVSLFFLVNSCPSYYVLTRGWHSVYSEGPGHQGYSGGAGQGRCPYSDHRQD